MQCDENISQKQRGQELCDNLCGHGINCTYTVCSGDVFLITGHTVLSHRRDRFHDGKILPMWETIPVTPRMIAGREIGLPLFPRPYLRGTSPMYSSDDDIDAEIRRLKALKHTSYFHKYRYELLLILSGQSESQSKEEPQNTPCTDISK